MAITRTGVFSENSTTGDFWYGSFSPAGSVGSLTVNSGSVFTMTGSAGPSLNIGVISGSLPPALNTGTVTVTGAGSAINLVVPSGTGTGAGIQVGRNGGNGTLNVLAGGVLSLVDTANTTSSGGVGGEFFNVGRSGGVGSVTVNNGDIFVSGTGASMNIGRQAGSGTLNIENLGNLYLRSTGTDVSGNTAIINVGRQGGTGVLNVTNGLMAIQGAETGNAFFQLGVANFGEPGGNGTANVVGTAGMFQGVAVLGGANSTSTNIFIGAETGSTGNMTLTNAVLTSINDGATAASTAFDAAFTINAVGASFAQSGAGGQASITIGIGGGTGTLTATGAFISADGANAGELVVGTLGGNGTLTASSGTNINVVGNDTASVYLGYSNNAIGVITQNTGEISVSSDERTQVVVGRNGTGTLNLTNAEFYVESAGLVPESNSMLFIGSAGGTGSVTLDNTHLEIFIVNNAGAVGINVGHYFEATDTGTGTFTMQNGSTAILQGGQFPCTLQSAGGTGSNGSINILSGSTLNLGGSGYVQIGGIEAGGSGALLIDGAGSSVAGFGDAVIGVSFDPLNAPIGTGALTLTNGGSIGTVGSSLIHINQGGTLYGGIGTINGTLNAKGGDVDLRGNGIGTITVNGDFNLDSSVISFDVNSVSNDQMTVVGTADLGTFTGDYLVRLSALNGFTFSTGQTRTLIDAQSLIGVAQPVDITGQHSNFAYVLGENRINDGNLVFTALNSGATGGSAILALEGGAGQVGANLTANVSASYSSAKVTGGRFSSDFVAFAENVTNFTGTALGDLMTAVQFDTGIAGVNFNGLVGNDTLTGSVGNDTLNGGIGIDTTTGGAGDDTHIVDNLADVIVETTGQGTNDRVQASVTYKLAAGVQVETLETTAATGNTAINLTGNVLAQSIIGNAGVNVLSDGGAGGADTLTGLGGNDTYIISNASAIIVEGAGQGTGDRVATNVSFTLAADDNIELFNTTSATGTSNLSLTGNALAQIITGNAGNNVLRSTTGLPDDMRGLGGDDTYRVFNTGDLITETTGNDRVITVVNYTLGAGDSIELFTTDATGGLANLNLTGNELGQTIQGNAGNNRINGAEGTDSLRGNLGADTFVFNTAIGATNIDTIVDFTAAADQIELDQTIFATIVQAAGVMLSGYFKANAAGVATDANDRIIYDTDSGQLYYDTNGNVAGGVTQFAQLVAGTALTFSDFDIVP